ncbi:MAG: iron-containing alcohol dehydrogenase [Candidatus Hodarchaeota archaeon]
MEVSFNFAQIPSIIFGNGKLTELYRIIRDFGEKVLIVTGISSLKSSGKWEEIITQLENNSIKFTQVSIGGEPSPIMIDTIIDDVRGQNFDIVVGIGGGSVIDAGKAISAMIPKKDSVKNYLEGVGNKIHDGVKIPYIAIPTTSGTGSEATKNAVISEIGEDGFKKSLRHDNFVPNYAIIDPQLILKCPPSISAACGMDAFTQLLEAYVSSNSNPMTDALAYSGMKYMKDNIIPVCSTKANDITVRAAMAYGSFMSGITLANAGLGIVHGLASAIGGYFKIPHGIVCGTLLAEATKMNIKKLTNLGLNGKKKLLKHAEIGALLMDQFIIKEKNVAEYCSYLVGKLETWTKTLKLEPLGKYGVKVNDIDKILDKTGLKNNPVKLNREDIKKILLNRI